MTPAIQVAKLKKKYGLNVAADDLSLTVPQGILFGFLGPTTAGRLVGTPTLTRSR
jgi:ABC-2 type transport system ATP-binding protein